MNKVSLRVGDIIRSQKFIYGYRDAKGKLVFDGAPGSRMGYVEIPEDDSEFLDAIKKRGYCSKEVFIRRHNIYEWSETSIFDTDAPSWPTRHVDLSEHDEARKEKQYVVESLNCMDSQGRTHWMRISELIENKYWNPWPSSEIMVHILREKNKRKDKRGILLDDIEVVRRIPFEKLCTPRKVYEYV